MKRHGQLGHLARAAAVPAVIAVVLSLAATAYGSSNHGKVGSTVTVKGQSSDVISVTVGKITDPILAYGADPGKRVIGIQFTVKNVGKAKYDDSPSAFVSTADGEISGSLITTDGPCVAPEDLKLTARQGKTFCMPFEIPKNGKLAFIQFETDGGYGTPAVFAAK